AGPDGGEAVRSVRRSMARNMARAHAEVVPVTLVEDADLHLWPSGQRDPMVRLARAIARACLAEPALNVAFDGVRMSLVRHQQVDLGVAVDTPDGLFVPVLRDVANRDAEDLRAGLDRLRADVLNRSIPPRELMGATITLSNYGTLFGRYASPVVVPPQVAIVGAGVIRDQVVAVDGQPVVHRILPLSLTVDHRAVTGGEAARFLEALVTDLQLAEECCRPGLPGLDAVAAPFLGLVHALVRQFQQGAGAFDLIEEALRQTDTGCQWAAVGPLTEPRHL